jgi:hypothetical protein
MKKFIEAVVRVPTTKWNLELAEKITKSTKEVVKNYLDQHKPNTSNSGSNMIDYQKLADSISYYENLGYTRLEAPWWVSNDIMNLTKPDDSLPAYYIEENRKYLVASGEQGLLYMANKGRLPKGRYVTTTPCFRNESIGIMNKKCFIKTELMDTVAVSEVSLNNMIDEAMNFFWKQINKLELPQDLLKKVKTEEGYDIEYNGIELGSYGIRSCPFLDWIYGTGCAEPRLTRALNSNL